MTETGTPAFHMSQIASIKTVFSCLFVCLLLLLFFFFSTNSQRNFIPYSLCFVPFMLSFDEVAYFQAAIALIAYFLIEW